MDDKTRPDQDHSKGAGYELTPLPQVVLWLTRSGALLGAETARAEGCCDNFNLRPGVSVHRALHSDCADADCPLLMLMADGLLRLETERILEWELPAPVLGVHVRLHLRRAMGHGDPYATLVVTDITAGRKITTTLRDANYSLSNLVEKSELERTRQINKLDRKLRSLSSELILAQEEERRRIATELHDSVGQWLSLSKLSLETAMGRIKDTDAVREVSRAFDCVRTSIKEVRAIVSNLRPSMLEEFGLVATLELLCQELQASAPGMEVRCEIDDDRARLNVAQCVSMVRILQEALQNVAKHASATSVEVKVSLQTDTATLSVGDNGKGFDTAATGGKVGLGMSSMRDRAQRSGGRMRLSSAPGGGTTLTVTWPLDGVVDKSVESGTYKAIRYGVSSDSGSIP